jgi:glycosyltransferase involved in cell wall biosynthesis
MLSGRDIICFANDWSGDPLSKKQVMLRLSQNNRILWINSLHNRRPQFTRKDGNRILRKIRSFGRGLEQVSPNIWAMTPLYVPFMGTRLLQALNVMILGQQLRWALRVLKFRNTIAWTFVPTSSSIVGTLGEDQIVYHCVDEYSAFSDAASEVRQCEQSLLEKCDLVIVCSTRLFETKKPLNPNTHLITHGVDYAHFHGATNRELPIAPELQNLPRPILGFHGLIADWVDLKMMAKLARLRPAWSIVLVGKADTDLSMLKDIPNVHCLGHRPYDRLPEYLRGFDVALLPFVVNELTVSSNPLKLREYLAAGLSVISAPLPEVMRFGRLVRTATTAEEYIREVEKQFDEGSTGPSAERAARVAKEAWEYKVEEMIRLVESSSRLKDQMQIRTNRRNEENMVREKP